MALLSIEMIGMIGTPEADEEITTIRDLMRSAGARDMMTTGTMTVGTGTMTVGTMKPETMTAGIMTALR